MQIILFLYFMKYLFVLFFQKITFLVKSTKTRDKSSILGVVFLGISLLFMPEVMWQELHDISIVQVQSYVACLLCSIMENYSLNLISSFFSILTQFSTLFVIRTLKMFWTYLKTLTVIWIAGNLLSIWTNAQRSMIKQIFYTSCI